MDDTFQSLWSQGYIPKVKILELRPNDPDFAEPMTTIRKRLEEQSITLADAPSYGYSRSAFWVGFSVTNEQELSRTYYLEVAYNRLDNVYFQVTQPNTGAVVTEFASGDLKPFSMRPLKASNFVLPIRFEARQSFNVYIRIETASSAQFPIRIWTPDRFTEQNQTLSGVTGGLIGMIGVMAAYNLFLFLSLREKSFLHFAVTLISYAVVEGVLTGFAFQYAWPNLPYWNDTSLTFFGNMALASLMLFSRDFLALRASFPRLYKGFNLMALVGYGLAILSLVAPYRTMIQITAANVVLSPVLGYVLSLIMTFRRHKPAYYYAIAFTFFVISAAVFTLSKSGIIPRNFLTEYSIHLSAVGVVVLFSFAMADRIHYERQTRENAQQSAIDNLQKYRAIYEKSLEGMFRVLPDGTLLACNPAFARLLGVETEEELLSAIQNTVSLVPASEEAGYQLITQLNQQGHIFGFETKCRRLDGSEFWGAIFANKLEDADHHVIIEGSIVDITDKKENELQLSYLAAHDPLTNLLNRNEFEKRLRRALATSRESGSEHALIFVDLDQFKIVNDTSGHVAGDELLRQIGSLFHSHTREDDALARLGGDEFALLLKNCHIDKATEIGQRLRSEVSEYRFFWGRKVFNVGASIGIVPVTGEAASVEEVLSLADTACYAAKDAGRNRVIVHSQKAHDLTQRQNEMQVATNLLEAIKSDQLQLYYQNIVSTRPEVKGLHYEILVRLRQNEDIISPGAFLPAAERYNMIRAVDRWVIQSYFKWLHEHPGHLFELHQANINLSSQTIGEADFEPFLTKLLDQYRIPASRICFEVTETTAIANMVETAKFIRRLQASGVQFALDDFGSGFSSYSYLKTLPVNSVKIDGSFIRDILIDPVDHAMVRSITEVAHLMELSVVAEFVENEGIQNALEEIGVDFMQGYHLHVPKALE
ncbi:sensor domain-containing phosphodiesterase [Hahella sp. CCB-MM4]|nr:sensor domain-containing phosphodiesterase [Hahella sp. CCB-MM4]